MNNKWHGAAVVLLGLLLTLPSQVTAQSSKTSRGAALESKETFLYGRFAVRMKSMAGNGVLSSFFTYHEVPNVRDVWNEVDIEILGRYENEMQCNAITPGQVSHSKRVVLNFNPHQAFHVYTFEWTPDYVAWFADGYEVYRQTEDHILTLTRPQKLKMNTWQPHAPKWVGPFDPSVLPLYAYYDWVRYYSYTPGEGDNFKLEWEDDLSGWDTTRWIKGSRTWGGNNSILIPENLIYKDGYVILCLTLPDSLGYRGGPVVDEDIDPPYVVRARAQGERVHVFFSEELEKSSAEKASNFSLSGADATAATLQPGGKVVELRMRHCSDNSSPSVTVRGVKDLAGHAMEEQKVDVAKCLPLPITINVGGEGGEGFIGDAIWTYNSEYGVIGGVPRSVETKKPGGLYATVRDNLTFYNVRVPEGRYDVSLMLMETEHASTGARLLDVYVEGKTAFENLDVFAEAGSEGPLEKMIRDVRVSDGLLDLHFKAKKGGTMLSGLKIVRSSAPE